ncbi:MAG: tetratricopeptide repeat protein [Bacteroidales bacterium]|nr:tetratricopeptide repeat protein [Bacteroidales bacterium]
MNKITIITMSLLLFAGGLSFAQSTKYKTRAGIVKEATMQTDTKGKSKKIPLKGVIIETNEQARATSSDSGTFKLNISKAPFNITKAEKKDYMMLIPEAGKTTYNDGKDIINILLVKKNTMNSKVGSQSKTATKNNEKKKNESLSELEKRKDRGEITTSEYIRMHDSITKVYSDRLQTLIGHCEESAKRWFMGQEIIDQQIDEAIIKGEFDKAVSLIESKGTTKQRIEEIEKSKAAYENHKKLAQQHDELAEKHKEVYESQVESLVLDHRNRANIKLMEVKYSEALTYLDSARVLQEEHFGLQDPDLALVYNDIGFVYLWQNYNDEALKWFDKALNIQEQVLDPLSPALATSYNNKGIVYINKNKDEEALNLIDKALQIAEQVFDPLSPDLVLIYNSKGNIYFKQNKNDEALKWYNKALNIQEQIPDSLNYYLATLYNNIGNVYFSQGNYEETLIFFDKALYVYEQVSDTFSTYLACTYGNKGLVYFQLGNYDEALKWQAKALRIEELVLDSLSQTLADSYFEIGDTYFEMKNYNKALEYYKKALFIYDENYEGYSLSYYLLRLKIKELEEALGE